MKFLLDENVDHRLAPYLNSLGYFDATAIGDDYPPSLLDEQVLALAYKERRILITQDHTDFGELIFRRHHPHYGVILFRLKSHAPDIRLKQERLNYALTKYRKHLHHFLVVTPSRIKVRETTIASRIILLRFCFGTLPNSLWRATAIFALRSFFFCSGVGIFHLYQNSTIMSIYETLIERCNFDTTPSAYPLFSE